jgi:hypothetical protein
VSGGSYPPLTWKFSWAQDGHVAVASNAYTGGNSDTASLHWDGDNLLFETDTDGFTNIYIDGALGGFSGNQLLTCGSLFNGSPTTNCGDFDFAGYSNASEGYAFNLAQFPGRTTGPDTKTSFPELFSYSGPGMISDGVNTFQGVRQMDNMTNQWVTPDPYAGRVEDPMSQRAYAWDGNNPIQYSDPSGYCLEDLCIVETIVAIGLVAARQAALNAPEITEAVGGAGTGRLAAAEDAVSAAGIVGRGESSAAGFGRQQHATFTDRLGGDFEEGSIRRGNGKIGRYDAFSRNEMLVIELKSTNASSLNKGVSQAKDYAQGLADKYQEDVKYEVRSYNPDGTLNSTPFASGIAHPR